MPLHFRGSVTHMDTCSASTHGLSFVVSLESIDGPRLYDRPGLYGELEAALRKHRRHRARCIAIHDVCGG